MDKKQIKMRDKQEKYIEYANDIVEAINFLFDEGSDCSIDLKELSEGDNLTHFFHALSTVAPNFIYNQVTGESINNLEFNHVANKLCFQLMNRPSKEG